MFVFYREGFCIPLECCTRVVPFGTTAVGVARHSFTDAICPLFTHHSTSTGTTHALIKMLK